MPKKTQRLPTGCTIDDVIQFPDQAATWLGRPREWVLKEQFSLPGVIRHSERVKWFHPRTFIEMSLERKKR